MFDGLLKKKFYSKCKSAIKLTKTRIEMIMRKRNGMQKFLRNDIADLLQNGLDINAYGRAEGLLVELNMTACYDFVQQFCACIVNNLSVMNKQRECPEECREAVLSLMFAAARFADLPELRELRSLFSDKYGDALGAHVSEEFVEKLKAMPPTKDMKVQLLQDIALESGLQWDPKALEQHMYNPPESEQTWSKNANGEKYKSHKSWEETAKKIDNRESEISHQSVWHGRPNLNYSHPDSVGCGRDPKNTPSKDIHVASVKNIDPQKNSSAEGNVSREEDDNGKPYSYRFIPPPYTRPKTGETETSLESLDESIGDAKPKPRSVRSKRTKPQTVRSKIGSDGGDGAEKMISKEAARLGLNTVSRDDGGQMEEEMVKDKLLMHYSSMPSPYEVENINVALKKPPTKQSTVDAGNGTGRRNKDGPPARTSLPAEPLSPTETSKGPARASTFDPDTGHVHPKLPDYEDFVARLAALRGK